jgi:hypothetical protein
MEFKILELPYVVKRTIIGYITSFNDIKSLRHVNQEFFKLCDDHYYRASQKSVLTLDCNTISKHIYCGPQFWRITLSTTSTWLNNSKYHYDWNEDWFKHGESDAFLDDERIDKFVNFATQHLLKLKHSNLNCVFPTLRLRHFSDNITIIVMTKLCKFIKDHIVCLELPTCIANFSSLNFVFNNTELLRVFFNICTHSFNAKLDVFTARPAKYIELKDCSYEFALQLRAAVVPHIIPYRDWGVGYRTLRYDYIVIDGCMVMEDIPSIPQSSLLQQLYN